MGNRLAIAKREIESLLDEKTIVLAIVIQLFIAGFSSFLVVGLVALYDPGSVSDGDVTVAITGDASMEAAVAAREAGMSPVRFETYPDAVAAFTSGRVGAVIATERGPGGGINVTAVAPESSLRTTQVVVHLRESLESLERSARTRNRESLRNPPLPLPGEPGSSPYFEFVYTVLVPLLVFLPVFISGSITSDSITEEYERGTLELLRVTPTSKRQIVEGKLLAYASIAPLQAGAWLLLLSANGIEISGTPEILLAVTGLTVLVTVFGAAIGLTFRDRKRSQLVYSLGVMLLFAVAAISLNPFNAVARLAVGSPGPFTYVAVYGYVAAGAVAYAAYRLLSGRN